MTQLRPVPAQLGVCPRDGAALGVESLHVPGGRVLVIGRCATCGHRILQDLPTGHGLVWPTSVDLDTRELYGNWFHVELRAGHEAPDTEPVRLDTETHRDARDIVFLNCLDFVYGHALLRLFNAQRHLDRGEALVVLVPRSLAHLVPDGVAETWVLDEPLGRLRGWLADLDARVREELVRFEHVALAPAYPHPHPSTWDLERFTGPVTPERSGDPSFALVWREDRFWGADRARQTRNLAELWQRLQDACPGAGASLVGIGAPGDAPAGMADLRSQAPSAAEEAWWLSVLAGADVAVGVHGSNMLLPSALAATTIELVPEDRFGNVPQASLVRDYDPVGALLRHRFVFGVGDLGDVTPERVAALAVAALRDGPSTRADMTGPASGTGEGLVQPRALDARFDESARAGGARHGLLGRLRRERPS